VFNEKLLTRYTPPEAEHQKPLPPPRDVLTYEKSQPVIHWEIEEILDSRKRGRGVQYLVHYKGRPREEEEWVVSWKIQAPDRLEAFHANPLNKDKARAKTFEPAMIDEDSEDEGPHEARSLQPHVFQNTFLPDHAWQAGPTLFSGPKTEEIDSSYPSWQELLDQAKANGETAWSTLRRIIDTSDGLNLDDSL